MHKVEIENSNKSAWEGAVFIDERPIDVINVSPRWDPKEPRVIVDFSVYADPLVVTDISEGRPVRAKPLEEQLVALLSAQVNGNEGAAEVLLRLLDELARLRFAATGVSTLGTSPPLGSDGKQ